MSGTLLMTVRLNLSRLKDADKIDEHSHPRDWRSKSDRIVVNHSLSPDWTYPQGRCRLKTSIDRMRPRTKLLKQNSKDCTRYGVATPGVSCFQDRMYCNDQLGLQFTYHQRITAGHTTQRENTKPQTQKTKQETTTIYARSLKFYLASRIIHSYPPRHTPGTLRIPGVISQLIGPGGQGNS